MDHFNVDFLVGAGRGPLHPPDDLFDFDFTYGLGLPSRNLTPRPPSELLADSSWLSPRRPNVRRGRQRNPNIKYVAVKFAPSSVA
jgi:hypothetical protein